VVSSLFDGASTHRTIYPLLDARSDPIKQNTGPATNKPRGIVNEIILFNKENARP